MNRCPGRGRRRLRPRPLLAAGFVALAAFVLPGASPTASAQTLRWAAQSDILTLDPHVQTHAPTQAVLQHAYEGLTRYDRNLQVEPALATGWQPVSPTEWRFQLRRDVRFHDGSPFTADDVVFSFERARQGGTSIAALLAGIRDVRKIDDHTVDILLDRPQPLLLRNLVDVRIMNRAWAQKNRAEKAQDLKVREDTFASRNANGTGPYQVRSWQPDQRVVLERNPTWWDTDIGNVREVVYTPIRQDATRIGALVAGEVDLVTDPPPAEVEKLRQNPGLTVIDGPEARTLFIGLDQASPELKYSSIAGRNPFADPRVRKALNLAVDADAIRRNPMRGLSLPAAILVAPGVNGWTPALDQRAGVDLEGARALLAEAGYPDGFDFTLDCPNNRYVYDEAVCNAVVEQWAKIGIRARVNPMPFSNLIPKLEKLDSSAWLLGWGSTTFDALPSLQALVRSRANGADGSYNVGRISDPAIDELIDAAKTENDPTRRDTQLREALRLTAERNYYVPLHHQMRPWAMKSTVTTVHKADDRPEARFATIATE